MTKLSLATRGTPLAIAQTRLVQEALAIIKPQLQCQVVKVVTHGDKGANRLMENFLSEYGKLIAQAEPQKKISREIIKANKAREDQILEAKKTKLEEKKKIKKLRSNNLPTIPSSLEDELKSNIFLRCNQNDLKIKLNMKNEEDFKVFRKVRDLKDNF